ncbi:M16 family metallopeptidase [Candidatus Palauibacter sp.]|uniref:M16 family metallopeptidase n=1 Tax=Candidatus Palauibacter sp. TaxID=3101350 RepID=UPI003B51D653
MSVPDPIRRHCAPLVPALAVVLSACAAGGGGFTIDYEKYELPNGLDVVLHVDRSDPVVAVAMTFHVGSSREVPGKTGFAHLFEHLFFLDSENLGPGGLDRLMTRVGSSTNGSTSRDRTNYFEVVPSDALEKALWAEADKLGFFINTVTEDVVAKEKQVVKNEKRQGVDNRPYGHASFVIDQATYPEGHPYRWQVIGSLDDLDGATLADTKDFHEKWYGPNNATLVVAGDIDVAQAREWIERYFGEIPSRPMPDRPTPLDVSLDASTRLFHEDNFAQLPQLALSWPTVPLYHPDSYPLTLLGTLLTDGKTAPFYEVIVEEEKLAPSASMFAFHQELAGQMRLTIRAFRDTELDEVQGAVERAFARFEEEGISAADLERVKAGYETSFYRGLSSVLGKAFQLAQYNIFAGDPGYVADDIERILDVTEADVLRVYETYVARRPSVATSFVPRGQPELALEGSLLATVVEEPIVRGAEAPVAIDDRGDIPRTPSRIDRSVEPEFGPPPSLSAPAVWTATLANGVSARGIEDRETPLVQFELRLDGGLLLEDPDRIGAANLLAEIMTEGTANRTPEELEQAIDALGASISVTSGRETFTIRGSTLSRNFPETMALVEEILLEPRFDAEAFELARDRVRNQLRQASSSPTAIAGDVMTRLLYGDHILGSNARGTVDGVGALGLDDVRAYYERVLTPARAAAHVAGAATPDEVTTALEGIGTRWSGAAPELPSAPAARAAVPGLYFVDVPNASQSVLQVGYLALSETDPDFWPAQVTNFRLGGGGFASDLTQILREGKGYTYGVGSGFRGTALPGPFLISSSVRSNVTYESLEIIRDLLDGYGPGFDEEDLAATRSFLLKTNARAFETLGNKLGILADMSAYGFPADYLLRRETVVREMTVERIRELAAEYFDRGRFIWLVVGDARTQLERLSALGLGDPVLLDRSAGPVAPPAAGGKRLSPAGGQGEDER